MLGRRRHAVDNGSDPTVTGAIRQAAQATGANFQYLLATAKVESNLNPNAAGHDVVGARPVPVHRADLARRP